MDNPNESKGAYRVRVKKVDGEWAAVVVIGGKRNEAQTYYAADREDAESSAADMRKRAARAGYSLTPVQ